MLNSVLLLDANSLYARSWYAAVAMQQNKMAVQLSLRTLLDLITDDTRTDCVITHGLACWDGQTSKSNKSREPRPKEYYDMMRETWDAISALTGFSQSCLDAEADDQVATAAYSCLEAGFEKIVIVSGDKDLKQLVGMSKKVKYYCLNNKDLVSEKLICVKHDIKHPSHLGVALAVIGDSVDNIGGIPGWGPKKLKKLFQDVKPEDTLEAVAEKVLAQIPEKLQEGFLRDLELTVLRTDLEGLPDPAPVKIGEEGDFYELKLTTLSHYAT